MARIRPTILAIPFLLTGCTTSQCSLLHRTLPPKAEIRSPDDGATFDAGDDITAAGWIDPGGSLGSCRDPDDPTRPDPDPTTARVDWTLVDPTETLAPLDGPCIDLRPDEDGVTTCTLTAEPDRDLVLQVTGVNGDRAVARITLDVAPGDTGDTGE